METVRCFHYHMSLRQTARRYMMKCLHYHCPEVEKKGFAVFKYGII